MRAFYQSPPLSLSIYIYVCVCVCVCTNEKSVEDKVLDATTIEHVYNPENNQILNTKTSSMWCAQSSDGKWEKWPINRN